MNTYDPMKGWVYRHMAPQADPYCFPLSSTRSMNQLPTGYANGSPRTYLGRTRRTSSAA